MSDWFRNLSWDADIAAAFDAKLARSRAQKAQYLRIQGSILKDSHPLVALDLLRRCVELGDDFHIAHALLDAAHAHYRLGEIEPALASLEAAMEQEVRYPLCRTSAPFEYAMLVVLHERTERYDATLAILDKADVALFPVMEFQREAARALILAARGRRDEARAAAERALAAEAVTAGWIPGHPEVGVVPNSENPLSIRLRTVADRRGS